MKYGKFIQFTVLLLHIITSKSVYFRLLHPNIKTPSLSNGSTLLDHSLEFLYLFTYFCVSFFLLSGPLITL